MGIAAKLITRSFPPPEDYYDKSSIKENLKHMRLPEQNTNRQNVNWRRIK
jgi:hypothetical protein